MPLPCLVMAVEWLKDAQDYRCCIDRLSPVALLCIPTGASRVEASVR